MTTAYRSKTLAFAAALALHSAFAGGQAPRRPPAPRRIEVTPEMDRTAFADSTARIILLRARAARLTQDSALQAYDAKSFLRLSVSMGVRAGPQKLLMRTEQSARVKWSRESGVWVEPTGRRTGVPMGGGSLDMSTATPIPYFPGRESLWFPSSEMGVANAEVNENEFIHPLATGAEAYYRYETGSTITIGLGDGRTIPLRELRITARRAEWRAFVGSFWFDVQRGSLVRAAYRTAAPLDMWQEANDEMRHQLEDATKRAQTDTGEAAVQARKEIERLHMGPIDKLKLKLAEGVFSPARMNVSGVTVEFGLYEGRFWLPKLNVAEGEMVAGFLRLPVKWQESFTYNDFNSAVPVPAIPASVSADDTLYFGGGNISVGGRLSPGRRAPGDTSHVSPTAGDDSAIVRTRHAVDSLVAAAAEAKARGDTTRAGELTRKSERYRAALRQVERHREACDHDTTYYAGTATRYNGALRTAIRLPCDQSRLENSPDLPGSIYDSGELLFGTAARDELLQSLDLGLQPGWAPVAPTIHVGLDLLRYNRIEALSVGVSATSQLGFGYAAQAIGRIGTGDRIPNGELSLTRSNGRAELRLGFYRRFAVANDDWGAPLSFGASLSNLLYAHDEGFYYRSWGAELRGGTIAGQVEGATRSWRLFAEHQAGAGIEPRTQASLGNLIGSSHFEPNIGAVQLTAIGAGSEMARTFGSDPAGLRLFTRGRLEGAFTKRADTVGASGYGRAVLDGTLSHHIGGFDVGLTAAAGSSVGDLPTQRAFYVGGLQTVRGQVARPAGAGRVGDSFWLGRVETGPRWLALRPLVFYDVGWAGPRTKLTSPGRPLSGAGIGVTLLDGLVRFDAARGIAPERSWRLDVSLGSRF